MNTRLRIMKMWKQMAIHCDSNDKNENEYETENVNEREDERQSESDRNVTEKNEDGNEDV